MTDRPVEVRTAPITGVDYPARTISLIAVPYNEWTQVEVAGRQIEESFAPGAFGAIDQRAKKRRLNVNLEHDRDKVVGRVLALHPSERDGLRAEVFIRRGDQFDGILDDAADGMFSASVGFAADADGQEWPTRNRRRITKAWLDHIALTFHPAFDGAQVLEVRSAPTSATPNLDRILQERAEQAYRSG